jgi:hypothetical protein
MEVGDVFMRERRRRDDRPVALAIRPKGRVDSAAETVAFTRKQKDFTQSGT